MQILGYNKDQLPGAVSVYLPDFIADDILDVDFAQLKSIGVTHILLDLDQTLRRAYSRKIDSEVILGFERLRQEKSFQEIAIVSNNSLRIAKYAESIDAKLFQPFWRYGRFIRKPNPLFFYHVMDVLGIKPDQAIMIGDKIRADVAGAHRAGIRAILLKPRGGDYWYDRLLFSRLREKLYYNQALRARNKQ